MKLTGTGAPTSTRALIVAMTVVVLSFVTALWLSQGRSAQLQAEALGISSNGVPSVRHLSRARAELYHLSMLVFEYQTLPKAMRAQARSRIEKARQKVENEIAAYAALPTTAGGADLTRGIRQALAGLLGAEGDVLTALDGSEAERDRALGRFEGLTELLAAEISKVNDVNAEEITTSAVRILGHQRGAAQLALLFGAVSFVAAVIATLLVVRINRAQFALRDAHERMLDLRASELEAFAGRIAHDLRSPLSALSLRAATGMRSPGLVQTREFSEHILRLVGRMDQMIDALLDFARAGAQPDSAARVDLGRVLRDVVEDVLPLALQQATSVTVEQFPPADVACSEGVLESLLGNLLRNAVKYVGEGQGEHRVVVRVVDAGARLRVEVEDTGPGLPDGAERTVFEPFVRHHDGSIPGLGLGLATVKKLAEAHGGCVGVHSVRGHGASFWFELPKVQLAAAGQVS